jgi:tetratricopeptide (TPR) repeat protein
MSRRTPAIVVLLLVSWSATGGASAVKDRASHFVARAESLRVHGEAERALVEADSLLTTLDARIDRHARALVGMQRGLMLVTLHRYPEGEDAYRTALRDLAGIDDPSLRDELYLKLAWVVDRLGHPASSDSLVAIVREEAVGRNDEVAEAKARLQIGRRHLINGHFDQAEQELSWSAAVLERAHDAVGAGDASNLLGIVYANQFRLEEAAVAFERTHTAAVAAGNEGLVGRTLNNIGLICDQLGDPERAAAAFREAYEMSKRSAIPSQLISGTNVAEAESQLGHYEDARALLGELLALAREHHHPDGELGVQFSLGSNARRAGRPHEALAHFRAAQSIARDLGDPDQELRSLIGESRALADLDSAEAALARLEGRGVELQPHVGGSWHFQLDADRARLIAALGRYEEALDVDYALLRRATGEGLVNHRMAVQIAIADAHASLDRPDSAIVWFRKAERTWESTRRIPVDPQWRERRSEQAQGFPVQLAHLVLEHGRGSERECIAEAYDGLQRYKARTLMERVQTPGREIASAEVAAVSLRELQSGVLRPGELLLDVYVGRRTSLLFAIDADSAAAVVLPAADEVEARLDLVEGMLSSAQSDTGAVEGILAAVGDESFGRVEGRVQACRRLLYSPDGPFQRLPLAAVRLAGQPLVEGRDVVRVPSATLLTHARSRPRSGTWRSILAVTGAGDQLAAARREVERLRHDYSGVETWSPDENGVRFDTANFGHRDVIHFATHANVRNDNPWRSGLVVQGAGPVGLRGGDVRDASLLTADTIAGLQIEVDLVVLAACESASGREIQGEGVAGLTAAFLAAGARAVVATLWPVEDRVAERFVGEFYRGLSRGSTVASALRAAQNRLRNDPATAHPRHWAGYVVVGDGSQTIELRPRRDLRGWWVALFGLAIVLLLRFRGRIRPSGSQPAV